MEKDVIKIAIADDHQLFRRGISLIFKSEKGFEVVIEVENGRQLIDRMNEAEVDVALLDLEMPELNGLETLRILREEYPSTRVLLLTMHDNDQYMLSCMQEGANGYLIKDAPPEELIYGVRRVHETGKYLSDKVSDVLIKRLEGLKTKAPDFNNKFDLGQREKDVLQLICQEYTTGEIAEKLFLSARTIESYRKRLLEKTNTRNTAGLVRVAIENGLFKS